jgi:4-hydroxybenzoate polyprenyltransferase/phosphoserine phosphatase
MQSDVRTRPSSVPVCFDLDGTLVRTNTLVEAILSLIKRQPYTLLVLPLWAIRGQAFLWSRIAEHDPLDAARLPYNSEVVQLLRAEQQKGRPTVLVTGAHQTVADQVARHLGGFTEVIGTSGPIHLQGQAKCERLSAEYGTGGYDYVGDSSADLCVWRESRKGVVVSASPRLMEAARSLSCDITLLEETRTSKERAIFRAIRPQQWAKNLLVFVPVVLGHQFAVAIWLKAALCFAALCLAASAAYMCNDLLALEADRKHALKSHRPLASGELPLEHGILLAAGLAAAAAFLAWVCSPPTLAIITAYLVMTVLYSVWLKKLLAVDVLVLSGLYCFRLFAGSVATRITLSPWTLAFAMFLFFSLALMKRYTELRNLQTEDPAAAERRGYRPEDMPLIAAFGAASGMTAVLVVALYLNSQNVRHLYSRANVLWAVCPVVMLWLTRLWLLANRGELHEDPVLFALRDRWSLSLGALAATAILIAL